MSFDADILVIGGGAAGLTVASGSAQLGARVVLVESGPALGGDCLHYGCVPSKTLIATARHRHDMGRAAQFGLPPVVLPPVDFRQVAARIAAVQATIQRHDSVERFAALGVEVVFGAARFVDEHTLEVGGRRISASRIVIATGSSPQLPALPGLDEIPYLTNRELFSLDSLPASLVILGGGPVAVEMAQAFARLGSRVTIVQRSSFLLSREDPDMAAVVQKSLEADGVTVLTGVEVVTVEQLASEEGDAGLVKGPTGDALGHARGVLVTLRNAKGERLEAAGDALLVALGRSPNITGLELGNAGVAYTFRGVTVDARMRTSQQHIFAAGDVTGAWQFTHAAGYEGGVVVANAILRLPRKADYTLMPSCTYCAPELASVGLNERLAAAQGIAVDVRSAPFASNDRALAEGMPTGLVKVLLAKGTHRVVGVQIVGQGAGELIGSWCVALGGKVGLAKLAGTVLPYPTFAESGKRVAGDVMSKALFSDTSRRILRILFGYRGKL